ncbi:response regulator [Oleidesulfovibrio sp.]|uniref:response regulator n=1 Tax=Oleidesulfovibrio sp. TaxID=2909707 RepID=UPI003A83E4D3
MAEAKPPHVLLVDDEPAFGDVLARRLRRRNIRVTHALDGDTALRMLLSNAFDVVLLDLKMAGISGLEVLNVLKRMVPDVPVIMISGHADQETVNFCLAHGASQYLPKPCNADEIVSIINRIQSN